MTIKQEQFDNLWKKQKEKSYNHWTRKEPENQIQLAFRNHWQVFQNILRNSKYNKGLRTLEVGAGRGSLSAYFSDAGYSCTLLDISPEIIDAAQKLFDNVNLRAEYVVGDVLKMPFHSSMFDIVFSIGLMEHIEDVQSCIKEQLRVLDEGGIFIAYVVPEKESLVQHEYSWINDILKGYSEITSNQFEKRDVYRTSHRSDYYLTYMRELGLRDLNASGIYSIPMISHSIDFPFSLMPEKSERAVVDYFKKMLEDRNVMYEDHPWLCDEDYGQAFLVWGVK